MAEFDVRRVDGTATLEDAHDVRREVFIEGQEVAALLHFGGPLTTGICFSPSVATRNCSTNRVTSTPWRRASFIRPNSTGCNGLQLVDQTG